MVGMRFRSAKAALLFFLLCAPLLNAPPAQAHFLEIPAQSWGHTYAGTTGVSTQQPRAKSVSGVVKSKFNVTYIGFPDWAKKDVQSAVDIWAVNFSSSVPISIEASWGRSTTWGILGSARPGNFFSSFAGAPDQSLWYASAHFIKKSSSIKMLWMRQPIKSSLFTPMIYGGMCKVRELV